MPLAASRHGLESDWECRPRAARSCIAPRHSVCHQHSDAESVSAAMSLLQEERTGPSVGQGLLPHTGVLPSSWVGTAGRERWLLHRMESAGPKGLENDSLWAFTVAVTTSQAVTRAC